MRRLVTLLLALLALSLPAAQCQPTPVVPSPSFGGVAATGGASRGGGTSGGTSAAGGTTASTGGSTVVPVTVAGIEWPECSKTARKLSPGDVERYRRTLGRRVQRQIAKRQKSSYQLLDLPSRLWAPLAPTLDQGDLGACTGNAGVQARVSQPFSWDGTRDHAELELLAVSIYSAATKIDPFEGSYPPLDTGSNGLAVMRVMQSRKLITTYISVFSFAELQRQLQRGPCLLGSAWYSSMYSPNGCGQVDIAGTNDGGHETKITGIDYATKRILLLNSWGNDWGAKRKGQGGFFWLTFGSFQRLMDEGAEIECLMM